MLQAQIDLTTHLCQTLTEYLPHLWELGQEAVVNFNVAKMFVRAHLVLLQIPLTLGRKANKQAHKLMEDEHAKAKSRVDQVTVRPVTVRSCSHISAGND